MTDIQGVVQQYMAGVPLKVIGLAVGLTPQRVSAIAIAAGCPSRKNAWAPSSGRPAAPARRG
jgi:hypothetical protein